MMNLFDKEQILKTYLKDVANTAARKAAHEAACKADRETAERLIKKGKMSLEDIADCVPSLSLDELKELEAEIMQSA